MSAQFHCSLSSKSYKLVILVKRVDVPAYGFSRDRAGEKPVGWAVLCGAVIHRYSDTDTGRMGGMLASRDRPADPDRCMFVAHATSARHARLPHSENVKTRN